MYYRNPLLGTCVDKYEVRKYIEEKGLTNILTKLYAVYNNADEIDIDKLPDSFVLKTTDGGGGLNVVLVSDKEKMDLPTAQIIWLQLWGQKFQTVLLASHE
jgi:glutathione synthase/RimK-type ligase-like ATP-grasp enzyme